MYLGVSIIGNDDLLPELRRQGVNYFFVGVGSVGDSRVRQRLFELGLRHGLEPVRVIHPSAIVSPSARIERGASILAGAIVSARCGDW